MVPGHGTTPPLSPRTVLRLLEGVPARGATLGGHVRYLAEACSRTRARRWLSSCDFARRSNHVCPFVWPRGSTREARPGILSPEWTRQMG